VSLADIWPCTFGGQSPSEVLATSTVVADIGKSGMGMSVFRCRMPRENRKRGKDLNVDRNLIIRLSVIKTIWGLI
jgi:hypothetical protein